MMSFNVIKICLIYVVLTFLLSVSSFVQSNDETIDSIDTAHSKTNQDSRCFEFNPWDENLFELSSYAQMIAGNLIESGFKRVYVEEFTKVDKTKDFETKHISI